MATSVSSGFSQGTSTGTSASGTQLVGGAVPYYNRLLGLNQKNYQSVIDSFGGGIRNAQAQLPGIYQGYSGLTNNILGALGLRGKGWGVATPAAQAIQRTFEQTGGSIDQGLVNAGLGNTTIRANLQNQNALQAGQAFGGLGAQLAQTAAGYIGQEGNAQLGARMQGLGMETGLSGQLGGALAGYRFANTFGNLLGNYSNSANQSQNTSSNSGSSFSPSGGGGGYGGSSGHPNEGTEHFGQNAGQLFPGNYLGAGPSGYYGTGSGYGGYYGGAAPVGGGSTLNLGGDPWTQDYSGGMTPIGMADGY